MYETPEQLHTALKSMATAEANAGAPPADMRWRHLFAESYTALLAYYNQNFSYPSPVAVAAYRKTIGDTVMTIVSLPKTLWRSNDSSKIFSPQTMSFALV